MDSYNCNQQSSYNMQDQNQPKKKIVAALLAFFLGAYGAHNFYLGYKRNAIIQLVVSIVGILLSCVIVGLFMIIGMGIWAIIEGIFILTGKINCDAKGIPLID